MKSVQGVISGPYFPVFGLNKRKHGPEITPYLDTFHAVREQQNKGTLILNGLLRQLLHKCIGGRRNCYAELVYLIIATLMTKKNSFQKLNLYFHSLIIIFI